MPRSHRHLSILLSVISVSCVLGCEGGIDEHGGVGGPGRGGVALQISPGVNVTSATYAIHGPNGFSTTGTLTVGATANVTVNVTGLPVGTGTRSTSRRSPATG
jgi:hypothetical protein